MSQTPNILVIDDEQIICFSVKQTLEQEGMKVDSAENGIIGLARLQEKNYDMVLIDLMMPQMSGLDVLDAVRKFDPTIVAIIITGYATIESAVEAVQKGAYDYIPKPFTPDELRNVVRKGLGRHQLLAETDRLRHEREQNLMRLAAEQSKLSTIINCMGEGLIATDNIGKLILINPIACKLLRIKNCGETGHHLQGYLNNNELEELISDNLKRKKFPKKNISREIVFDEENNIIYLVTLAPIKEKEDEINGVAIVLRDITEEKKLDRMKAEFHKLLAVVTHELKAPINAIEGYLDVIIKGYLKEKPEQEQEYLIRSRDKAEMLRNFVHDLLSLTAIESGRLARQMEPVDVRRILLDLSTFMENEVAAKNIKIIHDIPEQLSPVLGDCNTLTHLFTNLMSNAVKYNRDGGTITIRVAEKDSQLAISVIDTGCGIDEKDINSVFDEFFRSKHESIKKIPGTGLGLNITKRIAELHKGTIKVRSKLNEGSQFDVFLPVIKNA
ncbi:response regulator [candidate division KSB1 bacterium]|nr:response regulator [candidate division KSB1 bacterium]